MDDTFEIRLVDNWPNREIVDLYKVGGWWKESYDKAGISPLIEGSFLFAVAVDITSGKAVGMGRCISDGVSDAYIQDVVVKYSYRGRGIGSAIIEKLVSGMKRKGISWIGLIAEKGSQDFYRRLGFMEFEGKPLVMEVK